MTLRAVAVDEKAPEQKRLTVAEAAAKGTHLELLVAMRERIAKTVADENCPPRDLASLTRRLQDIAQEIATLELRAEQEAAESAVSDDEAFDASAV